MIELRQICKSTWNFPFGYFVNLNPLTYFPYFCQNYLSRSQTERFEAKLMFFCCFLVKICLKTFVRFRTQRELSSAEKTDYKRKFTVIVTRKWHFLLPISVVWARESENRLSGSTSWTWLKMKWQPQCKSIACYQCYHVYKVPHWHLFFNLGLTYCFVTLILNWVLASIKQLWR